MWQVSKETTEKFFEKLQQKSLSVKDELPKLKFNLSVLSEKNNKKSFN
jgi:hypothetical protein